MSRRVVVALGGAVILAAIVTGVLWRLTHASRSTGSDGRPRESLAGRVLDRLGRPIGGARIAARLDTMPSDGGGNWTVAGSDERGHFELRLATRAPVMLVVEAE